MKILSYANQANSSTQILVKSSEKNEVRNGEFEKDGNGNTRLNPMVSSHLDYLRIRKEGMVYEEFELLVGFLSQNYTFEFDKPWSPGAGAVFFPHRVIAVRGLKGGFAVDENGLYSLMVDLPGEYFDGKTAEDTWRLLRGLYHRYSVGCTRIDLAIDDYSYSLIPVDQMVDAWGRGQGFGFRKMSFHSSGLSKEKLEKTNNFGSRESGKMVRIYDHKKKCHRFESEFKRKYAQPIFEILATMERSEHDKESKSGVLGIIQKLSSSCNDSWDSSIQKAISSIAIGAIDFRDRGTRKDNIRAGFRDSVRLDFYQDFVDKVQAASYRIRLPRPARSIKKNIDWISRQCSQSLAMLFEGFGRHEFNLLIREVIEIGSEKMDNQKKLWVKEIQRNKKMYC